MDLFRVRLNCIDHYLGTPTRYDPQLRNDIGPSQIAKEPKVPVIRVFGSTETGQKVCAHIHGAFPYLYVEYEGDLDPDQVGAYIYRLHLSIDHALAVSYRRDTYRDNPRYVARITLVKGIPFYGFHVGYKCFLKIYMFNPIVMTRLADLLQQGAIMKHKFQPYEAHLQYLLQFMIDYNLYGCDYLDSSITHFRSPVPEHANGSNSSHLWHDWSIPAESITDDASLPRVSHCSIEVDICVQDILNRKLVQERSLHHDFIERTNPIPSDLKLVYSMAGLWEDETKRRKRKMQHLDQDSSPFPPEVLVSMSADPRAPQSQGWIHEEDFRDEIRDLITAEKDSQGMPELSFGTFANPRPLEDAVKTALESVQDLFPSNLAPALGLTSESSQAGEDPASSIHVDEVKASQMGFEDDFFPSDSDEEALTTLVALHEQEAIKGSRRISPEKKVGGSHVSLPDATDEADDLSIIGICPSGLLTGRPPVLPVTQDLLNAADEDGLVARTPKVFLPEDLARIKFKRFMSDLPPSAQPPAKRSKSDESLAGSLKGLEDSSMMSTGQNSSVAHTSPGFLRTNALSQFAGEPPPSNQTLNFAIVKDQNDPNTKLRLSQRGQLSSSQHSDDGDPSKHVSFDPSALVSSREERPKSPSESFLFSSLPSSCLEQLELESEPQDRLQQVVESLSDSPMLIFSPLPPPSSVVTDSLNDGQVPDVVYQDAYYSREKDVPDRAREYAGREFRLEGNTLPYLPEFDATGTSPANCGRKSMPASKKTTMKQEYKRQGKTCTWRSWEIATPPPTYEEVAAWWQKKTREATEEPTSSCLGPPKNHPSQIDGPTPRNKHGFKYSQANKLTSVEHEVQYMSTMSLEIHVNTRGKFVPNPEEDEVQCIFWAIKSDETVPDSQNVSDAIQSGIVVLANDGDFPRQMQRQTGVEVAAERTELDLMIRMVETVRAHDPDVLTGYEVHGSSWGYLIERARLKYDYNLCDEFSRMKTESHGRFGKESDRWGFNTTSTIRVTGRHMINIWRAMRGELNLAQYTMENVAWHLLHRRIPHYSWKALTDWYTNGKHRDLNRLLQYYQSRTRMNIEILDANELIARTSEQARLLGVDFFSVFSRGSQFKVESIMFRIAKPENFILVSPSRKQVGGQNALECLPLVMEPQSAFYNSPLVVLDFQSLYPSVMIAYNYCYSTFLGRITNWRGMNKMGFTEYRRQQGLLALLEDHINIAPNGMMYVKADIRKSLLAKMLTEILETRVMVKNGMKQDLDDKTLQQLLNNRQLALKLLANVTYGYTSASFSGRMPCSEIADSIVQTGRETLERAVAFIHSVERWGAEVVYGDTDSLFVYLKGRTRDQAFEIGNEIAKAITDMNPQPIKLKFEKVYHPCVLLAKKRYVGYKYESSDQVKPEFDAKGIETVRRDGTPAEQKIEEKALRLLFETADLSQIKTYFQRQCGKIMRNDVSVQDFCFAKEVRLGTYSGKGPPPAGALISTKRMLQDARAEPQYGERVPYVVITGAPGARLVDRCVAPEELLSNPHWQLDATYYISKNLIPPLERIFNLVGASVRQWYDEMPKVRRVLRVADWTGKKRTLEFYMKSTHCLICRIKFAHKTSPLCRRCRNNVPASITALQKRISTEERRLQDVLAVCRSCSGLGPLEEVSCDSKDCPVFWTRTKQSTKTRGERMASGPVIQALSEGVERRSLEW